MDIAQARVLARAKAVKDTTYRHLVSVEGVMRRLGRHFGEDEQTWALTGLFHDLDQDQTADDPDRHAYLAAEWLREAGVDELVVNGVLAHAHPEYQTDRMSKGVVAADAVAGLLVAAALVRPDRATGMKVSSLRKKHTSTSRWTSSSSSASRACRRSPRTSGCSASAAYGAVVSFLRARRRRITHHTMAATISAAMM